MINAALLVTRRAEGGENRPRIVLVHAVLRITNLAAPAITRAAVNGKNH